MLSKLLVKAFGIAGASVMASAASLATFVPHASAASFSYTPDSQNDAINADGLGGVYEVFGTAWGEADGKIFFGINARMPLGGHNETRTDPDVHVGWSDLVIRCSQITYAVRFAANNDSGVDQLGLYRVDALQEKAIANGNFENSTLGTNRSRINSLGGNFSIGNLDIDQHFDASKHVETLIASGTRLGDLEILSQAEIDAFGFDELQALPGQTIAFAFDSEPLRGLSCIYYVTPECNNDLAGGEMSVPVPEPTAVLGLLASTGLAFFGVVKRDRKKDEPV